MTRDLRSVLEGFGHDEAHGGELTPAGLDAEVRALTARVRRRRVLRSTAVGIGAAAAVTIGALTVQAVDRPDAVPADPTPSVTRTTPVPSPTPTPTPTPTSEEPPVLGDVTVHPLLPAAQPLRAGMLESAGDDWQLVTFDTGAVPDGPPPVLYLVDPQNTHYEVPTPVAVAIDRATDEGGYVEDWRPGSTIAVVFVSTGSNVGDGHSGYYVLQDLLSGETFGEIPYPEETIVMVDLVGDGTTDVLVTRRNLYSGVYEGLSRLTKDGAEVAALGPDSATDALDESFAVPSPEGSTVAVNTPGGPRLVRASDLSDLGPVATPEPDGAGRCAAWTWWDEGRVVLRCSPAGAERSWEQPAELWLVPVAGGAPQRLGDVNRAAQATMAADHLLVHDLGAWTAIDAEGTATPLPAMPDSWIVRSLGDRLLVHVPVGDEGERLLAVDPWTGQEASLGELDLPGYVFTAPSDAPVRRY